jgi:hypothetical protein
MSMIEKGTLILIIPSTPTTSHRGEIGIGWGWAGVCRCEWTVACVLNQGWEGAKRREEAGPREEERPSGGKESEEVRLREGVTGKGENHQQGLS